MSRVLPQNIQLTFEELGVERTAPAGATLAIVGAENDERLENRGLLACSGGTEDSAVGRDFPPAQNAKSEVAGDLGEDSLLLLKCDGVVCLEEDVSDGVLANLGEFAANFALGLALEEEVGNTSHDTRAITVTAVCTCGTTMGHCAQELPGVGDDLVRLLALDVANEAYTAGIFLVLVLVETLTGRK